MVEKHPFGVFVPKKTRYLFLGSFAAKKTPEYDWFFSSRWSQFWPMLREIYQLELKTVAQKQELFEKLGLAITDVILECDRIGFSSLDTNLKNLVFNTKAIADVLKKFKIEKIYFSSRFAENLFRKNFKELIKKWPNAELVTLPSPSPRYAVMSKKQKLEIYRKLLPK